MSDNGHLPDGAELATLALLRQANTALVRCPRLSQQLGREIFVRVRAIRAVSYLELLPPAPLESADWPVESVARTACMQAWLETLPAEERDARLTKLGEVTYTLLALGLVEPTVTAAAARDFANDADLLALAILKLSGILTDESAPVEPPSAPTEPAPAA